MLRFIPKKHLRLPKSSLIFIVGGGTLGNALANQHIRLKHRVVMFSRSGESFDGVEKRMFNYPLSRVDEIVSLACGISNQFDYVRIYCTAVNTNIGALLETPIDELNASLSPNFYLIHDLVTSLSRTSTKGPKVDLFVFGSGTSISGLPWQGAYGLTKNFVLEYFKRIKHELPDEFRIVYFSPGNFFAKNKKISVRGFDRIPLQVKFSLNANDVARRVLMLDSKHLVHRLFGRFTREYLFLKLDKIFWGVPRMLLEKVILFKVSRIRRPKN